MQNRDGIIEGSLTIPVQEDPLAIDDILSYSPDDEEDLDGE